MRKRATCRQQKSGRRHIANCFRRLFVEPLEARWAPAILTVNSLADGAVNFADTAVTLREAIQAANTDNVDVFPGGPRGSGTDEIRFQAGLTGTITLDEEQLLVQSNLTITGPGANVLAVHGNDVTRVFSVDDGTANVRNVTIRSLTITGGNANLPGTTTNLSGGGILNSENLTIQDCAITGNTADGEGGGIFNTGNLTVRNSLISGNLSHGGGGGISNSGTLLVENTTISENRTRFDGGGIQHFSSAATLMVRNSTITDNHSNNANLPSQPFIFGGGIALYPPHGATVLHNTIVASNYRGSETTTEDDIDDGGLKPITGTHNLIGTGTFGGAGLEDGVDGNQVGVSDPKLGPLENNGGPTKTHALLGGSSAVNAGGNDQVPAFSSFDQRGSPFQRIVIGTVDIGAVEAAPASAIVDTDVDEDDGNDSPGDLSLREAIDRINDSAVGGTITFSPFFFSTPRVILLSSALGPLFISADLTLTGPGANLLNVNGDLATRVFSVDDFTNSVRKVTISGLTIAGGSALAGAGILNREDLSVLRCTITQNIATEDIAFEVGGGGIFNTGTLTVNSSTISGNTTQAGGGGIKMVGGALTVLHSTISGNLSQAAGGGIESVGSVLTVLNSTISGNAARKDGGGIFASGGLTVRNSTIAQNQADSGQDGSGFGGGIRFADTTATLHNTIVVFNTSFLADRDGNAIVRADDIKATTGAASSNSSNNLIGTGGGGVLTNGTNSNQVGVTNPKLGALDDNSGPTKTHKLLAGSPAIDTGSNIQTQASLTTDQRGFHRIFNNTVDIGAYELQPAFPWHNFAKPMDVRGGTSIQPDDRVNAGDALAIINYINSIAITKVPDDAEVGLPFGFLDVIKDNSVAPDDALTIINAINSGVAGEGESGPMVPIGEDLQANNEAPISNDDLIALLAIDAAELGARRRR